MKSISEKEKKLLETLEKLKNLETIKNIDKFEVVLFIFIILIYLTSKPSPINYCPLKVKKVKQITKFMIFNSAIVVRIPACHAGDLGSIPSGGGSTR